MKDAKDPRYPRPWSIHNDMQWGGDDNRYEVWAANHTVVARAVPWIAARLIVHNVNAAGR